MDALTITVLSTVVLAVLTPIDWAVARAYYKAWRGGESIRYFAPTLMLIISVALTVTVTLAAGVSAVFLRYTGQGLLPPGVGLMVIVLALFLPSASLVWLLRLLRERSR